MAAPPAIEEPRSEPDGWWGLRGIPRPLLPWIAVFGFAIAAGVLVRFLPRDSLVYQIWGDRDLSRAAAFFHEPQVTGAEFDRGGRTPGGFYYLLLKLLLAPSPAPESVHALTAALDVAAILLLVFAAWRWLGPFAGLAAGAFFATSVTRLEHLAVVAYNPSYPFVFAAAAEALLAGMVITRSGVALPAFVLAVALAAQMHFSYLLLVPLALVVIAVFRIKVGWRSWLLSVAAFVVAYLPFLVAEASSGWSTLALIQRRQAILTDSPWLQLKTVGMSALAGAARNLLWTFFDWQPALSAWRAFGLAVFVAAIVWTAARLVRGHRAPTDQLARAMLLQLGLGLGLLSLRNISFVPRYIFFLLPAFALFMGAAFGAWADHLRRTPRRPLTTVTNVALMGVAVAFFYVNTIGWYRARARPVPTLTEWREIIDVLQQRLSYDRSDLERRVSLLTATAGGWAPISPTASAASYLGSIQARELPPSASPKPCALVLFPSSREVALSPADVAAAVQSLPRDGRPEEARSVHDGRTWTLATYRLSDDNCYHSVSNRYVPTAEERLLNAAHEALGSHGVAELPRAPGVRRFAVRLDAPGAAELRRKRLLTPREALRTVPLDVLLELRSESGRFQAVLHSNGLRGYDGITAFELRGSSLVVSPRAEGDEVRASLFEGTLGGWFGVALTPWRSETLALQPGTYSVRFEARDVVFVGGLVSAGPVSVPLTDSFDGGS